MFYNSIVIPVWITGHIGSVETHSVFFLCNGSGGGKSGLPRSQSESATGFSSGSRRNGRSREEQRRHTISNGVDYGLVGTHSCKCIITMCVKGFPTGATPLCQWETLVGQQ